MSIIAAGTTTTTALSSTGNTDGTIQLQVNGTTPSVTLNALGAVGVGAVPNFGTSGQALVSSGSTAAPTWANVTTSPAGSNTQIQYNNSGSFGASSAFTFDGTTATTPRLALGGTTLPAAGTATLFSRSSDNNTYLQSGSGNTIVLLDGSQNSMASFGSSTVQLLTGNTERFRIASAGQLGIGGANYGTSGQVLTSQGSGAAPTWATPSTGALVFLSSVTANNSATVDVETTFNSTYDAYLLVGTGIRADANGTTLRARMRLGGAYDTGANYFWHLDHSQSQSGAYNAQGSLTTPLSYILLAWSIGSGTTDSVNFTMHINNPSNTAFAKHIYWEGSTYRVGSSNIQVGTGVGSNTATTALTGIRFFPAAGLLVSGNFRLYGIANA